MEFREEFGDGMEQVPAEHMDRDRFVPATGSLDADVALVGEAPGANEVEQGEPFVGRAGQVLDDILQEIGIVRAELYITNMVKVRPPDNRDPTREEIAAWRPVLDAELDRVNPETVVPLGNFASQALTGTDKGISQIHGREFQRDAYRVIPTYHPAATLYNPDTRPVLEQDLRSVFNGDRSGQTRLIDL
ncbi:MAG: uracil-DNA glycosylase [Candidatus Nanohaloarchaea archaeon]|nr:uracil-DNA glycosylase [Candidatus Nanohaloarchaea archaeon]